MADIEGKNLRTLQHNGEYGNARVAILQHTLAAAQIGDVVVLGKLPSAAFRSVEVWMRTPPGNLPSTTTSPI